MAYQIPTLGINELSLLIKNNCNKLLKNIDTCEPIDIALVEDSFEQIKKYITEYNKIHNEWRDNKFNTDVKKFIDNIQTLRDSINVYNSNAYIIFDN
jgi:hypothetical protein